jgi:hypothetical protein
MKKCNYKGGNINDISTTWYCPGLQLTSHPPLLPTHQANAQRIFASVQEVQELPTGYALRLPNETDLLQTIMAFISYERLCCPFFQFGLEIEPQQGPIWLRLSGTEDVKFFLQSQEWFPLCSES